MGKKQEPTTPGDASADQLSPDPGFKPFDPFTPVSDLSAGISTFYQLLLNEVADEVAMNNMDGRLVYVNRYACENTGYTREELLGMSVTDIEVGLDLASARAAWQHMPAGVLVEVGGRHRRKDGSEYPVNARAVAFIYQGEKLIITIIRDISAELQVKDELGVLRQKMDLILEHAPAAIAVFDRDMRYLFVSRRFCADYRVSPVDIIGRSHYDVFPEISERIKDIHRRCLAGASEKSDEDPFPRADGSLDWVQWEMTPWYEADGAIGGVILFSALITEIVETRLKLESDQKKYADMFRKHSSIQMLIDPVDGRIVDVNDAAVKYYGWSPEEFSTLTIRQINTLSDSEITRAMNLAREMKQEFFQFRHRLKDGSEREVEVYSNPVDVNGKVFLHSIIQDVTTRKEAVKALQDSEKRSRDIIEGAPIGIFIQVSGKFAYANPVMCNILGMDSPAEILGVPVVEYVHPDYRSTAKERIQQLNLAKQPVAEREIVFLRPDGSFARTVTTGQPFKYMEKDGAIVYVRKLPDRPV